MFQFNLRSLLSIRFQINFQGLNSELITLVTDIISYIFQKHQHNRKNDDL